MSATGRYVEVAFMLSLRLRAKTAAAVKGLRPAEPRMNST